MLFTVPDYYPEFSCKMGACRHACCEGWPVSLSMNDYFRLLNEDVSQDLRRRIDTSLHIRKYADPDEYAFIAPRWDGSCPMRHPDGRCALQAESGEEALPPICRLYPRGIRTGENPECSCAASCEKVVELLIERDEPIRFIQLQLDLPLPAHTEPTVFDNTAENELKRRFEIIGALQDRSYTMAQRLMRIYGLVKNGALSDPPELAPVSFEHLYNGICTAERILEFAEEHSSAVHGYGLAALEYFGKDSSCVNKYLEAEKTLDRLLPSNARIFENLMVNHLFFERWPFHSGLKTPYELFASLCGVYGLLRFLALGYTAAHQETEAFTDCVSAAFRLIEHTAYDRYSAELLEDCGYDTPESLYDFIRL